MTVDLNALEALAKAATPGLDGFTEYKNFGLYGNTDNLAKYYAAANPAVVLELIAMCRLHWTTKTPTEPGWYFRRANSIVNVVLLGGSPEGLCVLDGGKLCPINWFSHGGRAVEWAGPILEPKG